MATQDDNPHPQGDSIRTYVLVGADNKGEAFLKESAKELSNKWGIVVLEQSPDEEIEDTIRKIKPPANVILLAHGNEDGSFQWHHDHQLNYSDRFSYADIFSALPRQGILSFTLNSCYGGSANAKRFLKAAPAGMMVQSFVGAHNMGDGRMTTDFIIEGTSLSNKTDMLLKAFDNFDPREYITYTEMWNRKLSNTNDSNPENALPHIVGIGGNPPRVINLDNELKTLNYGGSSTDNLLSRRDEDAFNRAVTRVQNSFDTQHWITNPDNDQTIVWQNLGASGESILDDSIAAIAAEIRTGKFTPDALMPEGLSEEQQSIYRAERKRIAYALTVAYLDESGEMQRMVEKQKDYKNTALYDAYGTPIAKYGDPSKEKQVFPEHDAYPIFSNLGDQQLGISRDERAYIDSVAKKLEENGVNKLEIVGLLKNLVTDFSRSDGNDALSPNLIQNLNAKQINTRGWEAGA